MHSWNVDWKMKQKIRSEHCGIGPGQKGIVQACPTGELQNKCFAELILL